MSSWQSTSETSGSIHNILGGKFAAYCNGCSLRISVLSFSTKYLGMLAQDTAQQSLGFGVSAQWQNACLACLRPQVQSPATQTKSSFLCGWGVGNGPTGWQYFLHSSDFLGVSFKVIASASLRNSQKVHSSPSWCYPVHLKFSGQCSELWQLRTPAAGLNYELRCFQQLRSCYSLDTLYNGPRACDQWPTHCSGEVFII